MGALVNGQWQRDPTFPTNDAGEFIRQPSQIDMPLPAREHSQSDHHYGLIVSLACPWAHRTTIVRALKDLEKNIKLFVVEPLMSENGWQFSNNISKKPTMCKNMSYLHQLYQHHDPHYTGRVTVPVLLDLENNKIICNESAKIIRHFNNNLNASSKDQTIDLYPKHLQSHIDKWNTLIYDQINNGVYRSGFATTQQSYDEACSQLFLALETIDNHLLDHPWMVGNQLTETDVRLFTTLIRFDMIYAYHFKCNLKPLTQYKGIITFLKQLYQWPKIKATIDIEHIKKHYYQSHTTINPSGIIPLGPDLSYLEG